jgi:hypothetical protein
MSLNSSHRRFAGRIVGQTGVRRDSLSVSDRPLALTPPIRFLPSCPAQSPPHPIPAILNALGASASSVMAN